MADKPKAKTNPERKTIVRKRRRRRRRQEELFSETVGFADPSQLPADKSAQTLRQDAMLEAQRRYGNTHAQRLIKKPNSDSKKIENQDSNPLIGTDLELKFEEKRNGPVSKSSDQPLKASSSSNGRGVAPDQASSRPTVQRGLWSSIKKGFSKVIGAITSGIKKVASVVTGGARKIFSGLKKGASRLVGKVKGIAGKVWGGLKKGANGLFGKVKSVVGSAWSKIKNFAAKLGPGIKTVWGKFKGIAKKVGGLVAKGAKWVTGKVTKGVKKVGGIVAKGAKWVTGKVKAGLKKVGGLVSKAASGLKKIWQGIKNATRTVFNKVKGFASKVWNKAKSVASKIAQKIKNGAKKLWSGVKSLASKIKNKIKGFFGKAWSILKSLASKAWTGLKWVGKKLWEKLTGIFHRVKRWITRLPERLGRLFKHLWEGVKSFKPWSLKWWKSLGKASSWVDFLKWMGESLIYVLEAAGVGELYETVMDFIKFGTRPLTGDEIAKAQTVFGSAIDYELVRVDENAILGPSWTDREYVSFHTINAWGPMNDHTLIHELTHVWQYEEMGAVYMPKALHGQGAEGYNYGGVKELKKRKDAGLGLSSFNLEQQGDILGDYYVNKDSLKGESLDVYKYYVNQVKI